MLGWASHNNSKPLRGCTITYICSTTYNSSGLGRLLKPLKLATFSLSPAYVIQSVSIFLLFACQYWITGQGNALSTNETKLSQIRTFGGPVSSLQSGSAEVWSATVVLLHGPLGGSMVLKCGRWRTTSQIYKCSLLLPPLSLSLSLSPSMPPLSPPSPLPPPSLSLPPCPPSPLPPSPSLPSPPLPSPPLPSPDCGYNTHKQCKDETASDCQPSRQLIKRGRSCDSHVSQHNTVARTLRRAAAANITITIHTQGGWEGANMYMH